MARFISNEFSEFAHKVFHAHNASQQSRTLERTENGVTFRFSIIKCDIEYLHNQMNGDRSMPFPKFTTEESQGIVNAFLTGVVFRTTQGDMRITDASIRAWFSGIYFVELGVEFLES